MRLKTDTKILPNVEIKRNYIGAQNFEVPMSSFVASIVAGCDVDVFFKLNAEPTVQIHKALQALSDAASRKEWLRQISFANCAGNPHASFIIDRDHKRLRPLIEGDEIYGLAALSIEGRDNLSFLSAETIGGFSTSVDSRGADTYIGILDYEPISAKRDARRAPRASRALLEQWADEQIQLLGEMSLEPLQGVSATYALADLDLDPSSVFQTLLFMDNNLIVVELDQLIGIIEIRSLAIFKSSFMNHTESHHSEAGFENYATLRILRNGKLLSLETTNGVPPNPNSLIGCLYRRVQKLGKVLHFEIRENVAKSHISGTMDVMIATITRG